MFYRAAAELVDLALRGATAVTVADMPAARTRANGTVVYHRGSALWSEATEGPVATAEQNSLRRG